VPLAFLLLDSAALANAQAPRTDGLKWDDGYPKAVPGGAAFPISANGGVDTTLYKDGLISSDKIKLEVFELDAKGQPKQPALYSLDIDVTGLKTFKGTTKRTGGFPPGNYQVRITTDKLNEGDGKLRTAILVKDNFQLKNQQDE
jgi:hypothetical protein